MRQVPVMDLDPIRNPVRVRNLLAVARSTTEQRWVAAVVLETRRSLPRLLRRRRSPSRAFRRSLLQR
jgi:hypothetical protein